MKADETFLPDFCSIRAAFAVVLIAELLAFVLTLAAAGGVLDLWYRLSVISLFVQWIALSCAALLCACRPLLRRLSDSASAVTAYLLTILCSALVSEIAWQVLSWTRGGLSLTADTHAVFFFRGVLISAIVSAVGLRYIYVQHQWNARIASESEARLQALQSRIRPHFLFNCMNTIASLTRSNPEKAEEVVENLADLFRASISDARDRVTLQSELDLAQRYLQIEALRLGDRLRVQWQVDGLPGDALVPSLMLQPLVENAVYHGIEPLAAGGTIEINGSCENNRIEIQIVNPTAPDASKRSGNQLALKNIEERLSAYYGADGRLRISPHEGRYRLLLIFPYEREAH